MKKSASAFFKALSAPDESTVRQTIRESIDFCRTTSQPPAAVAAAGAHDTVNGGSSTSSSLTHDGGVAAAWQTMATAESTDVISNDNDDSVDLKALFRDMCGDLFVDAVALEKVGGLGEGGFALVEKYCYTHASGLKQLVAVKHLKSDVVQHAEDLAHFVHEVNLLRKLRSDDVVRLLGLGSFNCADITSLRSTLFVVQDLMQGGNMKEMVTRQMINRVTRVYSARDALRWSMQIARGMKYLHNCRPMIVHRDLKLENILLTSTDVPQAKAKIADLGLHMRIGGKAGTTGDPSYYGGAVYDASVYNGSVHYGAMNAAAPTAPKMPAASSGAKGGPGGNDATVPGGGEDSAHAMTGTLLAGMKGASEGMEGGDAIDDVTDPRSLKPYLKQSRMMFKRNNADPVVSTTAQASTAQQAVQQGVDQMPLTEAAGSSSKESTIARVMESAKASRGGWSSKVGSGEKVGSLMYMAPEVIAGAPYDEKVDVFAFGVMMYEMMMGVVNLSKIAARDDPSEVAQYAERVASGWREHIPSAWPEELRQLIAACWTQCASQRPSFSEILTTLRCIDASDCMTAVDVERVKASSYNPVMDCGCCCVQ